MSSLHQSGPVSTSGTSVASKFAPETSQSVSALLAYVPQCSVSVSQGAQGAVHVSAAVLPSPQPPVVPSSVVYCTFPSSSVQATSASSPQAVAANLVSKLISQLSCSRVSNPVTPTVDTTSVAHNPVTMSPNNTGNVIDPHYLFWVMIVFGNISRCQGCSERIMRGPSGKPLPPPDDLVLQHKEQVTFQNPKTGNFQLSCDLRNVYYHARMACVRRKYPTFNGQQHLRISNDVQHCLSSQHKAYLAEEFNIRQFC